MADSYEFLKAHCDRISEQWQPINTAPKDGQRVHVARYMPGYGWILGVGRYEQVGVIGGWISWGVGVFGELGLAHPTHWQRLPAPPSDEASGSGVSTGQTTTQPQNPESPVAASVRPEGSEPETWTCQFCGASEWKLANYAARWTAHEAQCPSNPNGPGHPLHGHIKRSAKATASVPEQASAGGPVVGALVNCKRCGHPKHNHTAGHDSDGCRLLGCQCMEFTAPASAPDVPRETK